MLEPFTLKRLLLLEGGELALQRHAFVVDAAPVLRYNRVGFCIIGNRQRLQDWHQGVNTFLNRTVLGLFFLPQGIFSFACAQPGAFGPFIGHAKRQRL